jgi:hypothetical protein
MQEGGPIAFYEVAATLIPVLLLGGVVLEGVKAPPLDSGEDQSGAEAYDQWRSRFKNRLVALQIPAIGVTVALVELVALDTIASGETDWPRAALVGGTLVLGMVSVVFAVWAPWAKHFFSRTLAYTYFGYSVALLAAVILIWQLLPGSYPFFGDIATPAEGRSQSPSHPQRTAWERIWLEHLIATSDFRIGRLEAEAAIPGARGERAAPRLRLQERVQGDECRALDDLVSERSSAPPGAVCSAAG